MISNSVNPVYKGHSREPENDAFISPLQIYITGENEAFISPLYIYITGENYMHYSL